MKKKKIIKIIVGTNNAGKLEEIRALLPKKLKIYSPKDFKLKYFGVKICTVLGNKSLISFILP